MAALKVAKNLKIRARRVVRLVTVPHRNRKSGVREEDQKDPRPDGEILRLTAIFPEGLRLREVEKAGNEG